MAGGGGKPPARGGPNGGGGGAGAGGGGGPPRAPPADRHGPALEADRDEPPEDVREERRRLDVHAEAIGPHLPRVRHDELEDRRLEIPARRVEAGRGGAPPGGHLPPP